jgi:hypothetical protein
MGKLTLLFHYDMNYLVKRLKGNSEAEDYELTLGHRTFKHLSRRHYKKGRHYALSM